MLALIGARKPSLVGRLVIAGGAAGLAVHQSVGADADVECGLAEDAEFIAFTGVFRLLALCTFDLGRTGSVAHAQNVAQEAGSWNVTEVMGGKKSLIFDC